MENTNIHPKNLMSSKEIMKLARKFYKENFKKLWPLYILGGLGGMGFSYKSSSGNSTYNPLPNFNIPLQVWILIGVIFIAIYIFLFISKIALLKSISDTSKEQFVGVKDSYKKGFAIFWSFILITIMISLSVLGAFALLIIPGIILSVYLSFGTYELIDKQKKGFQALLGSWSLVRGRWWTFFGKTIMIGLRIFLTGLIYFTAISILALILIVPGIGSHVPALLIIGISLGVLAYLYLFFVFLIPLTIIAMFELYYNFCDVKESDKVADEALDKKRKRKLIISMVIGVVASIFIILAILVMFYSAKQPGGTTNYSDESISSFINREVDRAKNNISLPRKNSETTTLTDITAEPNAVRFHMVHNNISYDITDITSDMLKKSLIPVVCGTGFSKELFERNVNVEWSYIIENTQKTFLVTITKDDCSQ